MREVAVVDYGLCNLDSVARAIEECGGVPRVTDDASVIRRAGRLVLPGVGAFSDAMARLRASGLDREIVDVVRGRQVPFLGICLGMQLMAGRGFEGGENAGLGLVEGEVLRLVPKDEKTRIPHVGWNEVQWTGSSRLNAGIPDRSDFYFVHSYHLVCASEGDVLAWTPYCDRVVSAIAVSGNVFGVQFHPEKSQRMGFQILRNFIAL